MRRRRKRIASRDKDGQACGEFGKLGNERALNEKAFVDLDRVLKEKVVAEMSDIALASVFSVSKMHEIYVPVIDLSRPMKGALKIASSQ